MSRAVQDDHLPDPGAGLDEIRRRIDIACGEAGKDAAAVTVTAVSKKHEAGQIERALAAGHRVFGENRVQEAMSKWPALKEKYPDAQIRLIGPLQTNKAKDAVAFFDAIETVDRPKLARMLADAITSAGRSPNLFVQINIGDEPQKAGVGLGEADEFLESCKKEYGLTISGLMCIPPLGEPPAPYFALLKKIADRNGVGLLSMGMSADFETAVQLGATHVRIGTQIFGPRPN